MENPVFLMEAFNDTEATLILGMLKAAGIPAERKDSDPYVGVMRVVGGQAYGINLYVPENYLEQAQKLLRSAELPGDDLDEE